MAESKRTDTALRTPLSDFPCVLPNSVTRVVFCMQLALCIFCWKRILLWMHGKIPARERASKHSKHFYTLFREETYSFSKVCRLRDPRAERWEAIAAGELAQLWGVVPAFANFLMNHVMHP